MNEQGLRGPSGLRGVQGSGVASLPHYGLKGRNQPEIAGSLRPRGRVFKSLDTGSPPGLRGRAGVGHGAEPPPPASPAAACVICLSTEPSRVLSPGKCSAAAAECEGVGLAELVACGS